MDLLEKVAIEAREIQLQHLQLVRSKYRKSENTLSNEFHNYPLKVLTDEEINYRPKSFQLQELQESNVKLKKRLLTNTNQNIQIIIS